MTKDKGRHLPITRRGLLQGSAALGAGAALGGLMPSLSRAQDAEITMWWWGEQELPGLKAFVDDSVANYAGATVNTMLQDTAVVISQFQTAAAAGEGARHAVLLERHLSHGERVVRLCPGQSTGWSAMT